MLTRDQIASMRYIFKEERKLVQDTHFLNGNETLPHFIPIVSIKLSKNEEWSPICGIHTKIGYHSH